MKTKKQPAEPLITVNDIHNCTEENLYLNFHFLLKGKKVYRRRTNERLSKHEPFWGVKRNRAALADIVENIHEKYILK